MNENEIKKDNIEKISDSPVKNSPPKIEKAEKAEKVTEYNEMEIFDFDAHRKAKADQEKAARDKAMAAVAAQKAVNHAPSASVPSQSAVAKKPESIVGNVDGTKKAESLPKTPTSASAAQSTPSASTPRKPVTPPTSKNVTDVKGEKVVYGAASELRRRPSTPSKNERGTVKVKKIKPVKEKVKGDNPLWVLSKALIYIALVLLISCLCAYFIIVVANDVFAFVKADAQVEVVIPENATLDEIAEILHESKIIKYPKIFVLYAIVRGKDSGIYTPGIKTVSPSLNYDELLLMFVDRTSTSLTEVSVTIPEGYSIDDIIELLVSKGIGTKEGFIDAIQNGEYDYWFLNELTDPSPDRRYRLEGYLFPDTYYFYKESDESVIIDKMLLNFYNKFGAEYKQECERLNMSVDDVINIASIIQMEAKYSSNRNIPELGITSNDYSMVSAVIHNRLSSNAYGRRLQCDSTTQYVLDHKLTADDLKVEHPYNTYTNAGLPPGPITNPSLKAIRAALYPEIGVGNVYFFVTDVDGLMLYGRNDNEHNANIAKVKANAEAAKKEQNAA